jgi:hypothetical protein
MSEATNPKFTAHISGGYDEAAKTLLVHRNVQNLVSSSNHSDV